MIEWLKGKKTYGVITAAAVLALLQGFGVLVVPDAVWQVIVLLGGATASAKVNRIIETLKEKG